MNVFRLLFCVFLSHTLSPATVSVVRFVYLPPLGDLRLIDHNREPLKLKCGDQVLICTDGLYRLITDDEITNILNMNQDTKTSLQMMELAVRKKAAEKGMRRDNMTVLLIKVK